MKTPTTLFKLILFAVLFPVLAYAQVPQNVFPTTGFVGIGTSTPMEALQIKTGTIQLDAFSSVAIEEPRFLMIDRLGKVVVGPCLSCPWGTGTPTVPTRLNWWKLTGNDSITNIHFLGTKNNAPLSFRTFNTERMTITANGNISMTGELTIAQGISVGEDLGVYNDANVGNNLFVNGKVGIGYYYAGQLGTSKLAVNGRIHAREVKVSAGAVPDYVFETDYKLMSLTELEGFIKENKHLPGIKSAKEVEKNEGIDLGEMNLKLLEKVEELTLHIIRLQKEVDELKIQGN